MNNTSIDFKLLLLNLLKFSCILACTPYLCYNGELKPNKLKYTQFMKIYEHNKGTVIQL